MKGQHLFEHMVEKEVEQLQINPDLTSSSNRGGGEKKKKKKKKEPQLQRQEDT